MREGDLREPSIFADDAPFDLVTGSPPYFPPGTAVEAAHPQAVPARIEVRGTVADYARTAARILAPGGLFAFVFPFAQRERAEEALREHGLVLLRRRDVVFKEGEAPMISLFAAARAADLPAAAADVHRAAADDPPRGRLDGPRVRDGAIELRLPAGGCGADFNPPALGGLKSAPHWGSVYVPGTEITPP